MNHTNVQVTHPAQTATERPLTLISRAERKRLMAQLHAAQAGTFVGKLFGDESTAAADLPEIAQSFTLFVPVEVAEFYILPYCTWPSIEALQIAYPILYLRLRESDHVWQYLFAEMRLGSSHKWRQAKQKRRAVVKHDTTITFRKRVMYVLQD